MPYGERQQNLGGNRHESNETIFTAHLPALVAVLTPRGLDPDHLNKHFQNFWPTESISSVQSLSDIRFFATPWTAAHQAFLSITNSQSLLKLMPIELGMPSNQLSLCCPHLLLPSIFPSTRVFSKESVLHIRWPNYWSFSFSTSPSNEYSGLISFTIEWIDLLESKGLSRVFSNTTVQKNQFFGAQTSFGCNSQIHTWLLEKT